MKIRISLVTKIAVGLTLTLTIFTTQATKAQSTTAENPYYFVTGLERFGNYSTLASYCGLRPSWNENGSILYLTHTTNYHFPDSLCQTAGIVETYICLSKEEVCISRQTDPDGQTTECTISSISRAAFNLECRGPRSPYGNFQYQVQLIAQ